MRTKSTVCVCLCVRETEAKSKDGETWTRLKPCDATHKATELHGADTRHPLISTTLTSCAVADPIGPRYHRAQRTRCTTICWLRRHKHCTQLNAQRKFPGSCGPLLLQRAGERGRWVKRGRMDADEGREKQYTISQISTERHYRTSFDHGREVM